MNSKELRNLQEAYMEVVENQQQLDESVAGRNDARIRDNIKRFKGSSVEYTPPRNWDPNENRGQGATISPKQVEKRRRKALRQEEVDFYDIILSHLLDEGYAETLEAAKAIMVSMSEEWRECIVGEVLDEAEKPFPHEKVKAKQVALRDKGSAGLERRMKMGMAVRRAKEAEKTGGSQRDAGKGWYHGR